MTKPKTTVQQVPSFKGKDKIMAIKVAKTFINSLFTQGHLTQQDLSLPKEEFEKKIKDLVDRSELSIGVDHRDDLIKKADTLVWQKEHEYAKVLYAMFFEHSINYLISHECQKRKIDEKTKIEIIKSVDIFGKLTWLLKLLDFPKFNDTYKSIIKKLSDDRNAFIHYKWKADNEKDANKTNPKIIDEEFKKIKSAVKYMKHYSTTLLYQKNKNKLDKKLQRK